MPGLTILPPDYPEFAGPLAFLAGPIQGAPNWQAIAALALQTFAPTLHVANPRRDYLPGSFDYAAQVEWETHHLRRAGTDGVILFWLAREEVHHCDRAYAQTTRFELAEWKVRHERDGARLVVGVEDGFSGARYIRHRLARDCPGVPVCDSLAGACRRAAELVTPPHSPAAHG
jgi:hypothetical protein